MGIEFVLKSIFALTVIIIAANYLMKQLNKLALSGTKNIRIIERMPLSKSSSLYIVAVMGRYYLMSGTEQHNEILKELDGAEIEHYLEEENQPVNQSEWLTILKEKVEKRKQS